MASIIIFATLWEAFLKEGTATSLSTKALVVSGLALLIASTLVDWLWRLCKNYAAERADQFTYRTEKAVAKRFRAPAKPQLF
jgi:hypothetical protein